MGAVARPSVTQLRDSLKLLNFLKPQLAHQQNEKITVSTWQDVGRIKSNDGCQLLHRSLAHESGWPCPLQFTTIAQWYHITPGKTSAFVGAASSRPSCDNQPCSLYHHLT